MSKDKIKYCDICNKPDDGCLTWDLADHRAHVSCITNGFYALQTKTKEMESMAPYKEIEALQEENRRLVKALKLIAYEGIYRQPEWKDTVYAYEKIADEALNPTAGLGRREGK